MLWAIRLKEFKALFSATTVRRAEHADNPLWAPPPTWRHREGGLCGGVGDWSCVEGQEACCADYGPLPPGLQVCLLVGVPDQGGRGANPGSCCLLAAQMVFIRTARGQWSAVM